MIDQQQSELDSTRHLVKQARDLLLSTPGLPVVGTTRALAILGRALVPGDPTYQSDLDKLRRQLQSARTTMLQVEAEIRYGGGLGHCQVKLQRECDLITQALGDR